MPKKPDIKKMISNIKKAAPLKKSESMRIDISYDPYVPRTRQMSDERRERCMKQDALDMGAHGAEEFFELNGGEDAGAI